MSAASLFLQKLPLLLEETPLLKHIIKERDITRETKTLFFFLSHSVLVGNTTAKTTTTAALSLQILVQHKRTEKIGSFGNKKFPSRNKKQKEKLGKKQ